jgi:hypothetical protein
MDRHADGASPPACSTKETRSQERTSRTRAETMDAWAFPSLGLKQNQVQAMPKVAPSRRSTPVVRRAKQRNKSFLLLFFKKRRCFFF